MTIETLNRRPRGTLALSLAALSMLAGCASFSPDGAFGVVERSAVAPERICASSTRVR